MKNRENNRELMDSWIEAVDYHNINSDVIGSLIKVRSSVKLECIF